MNRLALTSLITAGLALAACNNNEPEVVGGPVDPQAEELANAAPVKLPPSIVASHSYRCGDNSVLEIDWMTDGTENSARVTPKGSDTVRVAQPADGGAYAADGASLSGSPTATNITFNGKSCKR